MLFVLSLVLAPALWSVVVLLGRRRAFAAPSFVLVALGAAALAVAAAVRAPELELLGGHVRLDATARLFLGFTDPIFFGIAAHLYGRSRGSPDERDAVSRLMPGALLFLGSVNAAILAHHFLVAWVALELGTLAATPLIARPGSRPALEASWRYLLFSCVGLGLVLLGLVCIAHGYEAAGLSAELFMDRVEAQPLVRAGGFGRLGVTLLVLGLGTKLGLAPMYAWLPDAYAEAPPAITALLGAVQFNAALLLLLRVLAAFGPAYEALISAELLLLGLLSMLVSTLGIVVTRDLKRLIAFASINHAGVIAIGLGSGAGATYGVLLYAVSNAFIKAILFLSAAKLEVHYRTSDTRQISGLLHSLPYSGAFFMTGTFALLGFPPFGSFFGELMVLSALVGSGHMLVFAGFCTLTSIAFIATGRTLFPMIWGQPSGGPASPPQRLSSALPKLVFAAALVGLGVYIPPPVNALLERVAQAVEGL